MVFFVAYPHVYGGVERELELVAPALQQRGWAVSVVLPGDGIAAERFRSGGLEVEVGVHVDVESYTRMLWTGLRKKVAYLPG